MNDSEKTLKRLDASVSEGLGRLSAVFSRDIQPGWQTIWRDCLRDMDPEEVREAFRHIERTFHPNGACPFPPPSLLRRTVLEPKAEAAWRRVLQIFNYWSPDVGYADESYKLPDAWKPHIEAAGGMVNLFNSPLERLIYAKKEFVKSFIEARPTQ